MSQCSVLIHPRPHARSRHRRSVGLRLCYLFGSRPALWCEKKPEIKAHSSPLQLSDPHSALIFNSWIGVSHLCGEALRCQRMDASAQGSPGSCCSAAPQLLAAPRLLTAFGSGLSPLLWGVPAWPRPLFICGEGCQAGGCLLPTLPSIQFHQTSEIRKQLWLLALKELRGLRFPFGFCRLCRAILTPLFHSPAVSQRPPPAQRLLGAACAHRGPPPRNPPCPPPPAPRYGQCPEPSAVGSPHSPPGMEDPDLGGEKSAFLPPRHSLPIKTLILFLISRWKGGMSGAGGFLPPLALAA